MKPVAVFNKWNYYIGKGAATAYIINKYSRGHHTSSEKIHAASALYGIWGMPLTYKTGGWVLAGIAKNPAALAITYAVLAGAYTAGVIDEEEGEANYWGFVSGGYYGNDPNYLRGDVNDSGYFNVVTNLETIIESNQQGFQDAVSQAAEDAYIAQYWAEQEYNQLKRRYEAMTPAEQKAFRVYWTNALIPTF